MNRKDEDRRPATPADPGLETAAPRFAPTPAQQAIIAAPVGNLLVSAAAGSGKTAVMTDRIVSRIVNQELEINQVLVMTFTEAAASQMREKIQRKLEAARTATTEARLRHYLTRQLRLLPGSSISTIHAFCLTVIRNFSHLAIGPDGSPLVEPGFAVDDGIEADLLCRQALDAELARRYEQIDLAADQLPAWTADFFRLVDSFGNSRSDEPLRELILRFFYFLRSMPDYLARIEDYWQDLTATAADFAASRQAGVLCKQAGLLLDRACAASPELLDLLDQGVPFVQQAKRNREIHAQMRAVLAVLSQIQAVLHAAASGPGSQPEVPEGKACVWDTIRELARSISDLKMPQGRKTDAPAKQLFLEIFRREVAEAVYCLTGKLGAAKYQAEFIFDTHYWFARPAAAIAADIGAMLPAIRQLFDLVLDLDPHYQALKREQGLIDFSDFEHLALHILRQPEAGVYYRQRFREIYIDEYQDTSSIQESLLQAIGQDNIFMVGDVKQSIYRFRHARPQIFMAKCALFSDPDRGKLYALNQNFRSVAGILGAVNEIFYQLMSPQAGEIDYDQDQALVPFRADEAAIVPVELLLVDTSLPAMDESGLNPADGAVDRALADEVQGDLVQGDTARDDAGEGMPADRPASAESDEGTVAEPENEMSAGMAGTSVPETDSLEAGWLLSASELNQYQREALVVIARIRELLAAGRKPGDIVILSRSRAVGRVFSDALANAAIAVLEDSSGGFLDSPELKLMEALLMVMDNPRQDIPLAAVMRSPLCNGGFPADALYRIRLADRQAERQARQELAQAGQMQAGQIQTAQSPDWPVQDGISPDDESETDGEPSPVTAAAAYQIRHFHEAVWAYAENGPDDQLRAQVRSFLAWLEHWRDREQTLRVSEWLDLLFEETGYLSQVAASPNGAAKIRELRQFQEWASQYELHRRLGLFSFVRYIERLRERNVQTSPFGLEKENSSAIRVMTIHRSKGLEFPVVFLVGTHSNIAPRARRDPFLVSEKLGVGFDWIDPDRRLRYPTHLKFAMLEETRAASQAEEMRLLYVAMTRAKDQLFISAALKINPVKGLPRLARLLEQARRYPGLKLPAHRILGCRSYLEWIALALARHPAFNWSAVAPDLVAGYQLPAPSQGMWRLNLCSVADYLGPQDEGEQSASESGQISSVSPLSGEVLDQTGQPVMAYQPVLDRTSHVDNSLSPGQALDTLLAAGQTIAPESVDGIWQNLFAAYRYDPAARLPVKLAVSEFKRREQAENQFGEDQAITLSIPQPAPAKPGKPSQPALSQADQPAQASRTATAQADQPLQPAQASRTVQLRGINLTLHNLRESMAGGKPDLHQGPALGSLLHRFLRQLDLPAAVHHPDAGEIRRQLDEMVQAAVFSQEEATVLQFHLADLTAFARSDLAAGMAAARNQPQGLYREIPFTLALPVQDVYNLADGFAAEDQVLVQGIIDCWFCSPQGIILVDYKSDWIEGDDATCQQVLAARYSRQLDFYAQAIEAAVLQPVVQRLIWHIRRRRVFIIDGG